MRGVEKGYWRACRAATEAWAEGRRRDGRPVSAVSAAGARERGKKRKGERGSETSARARASSRWLSPQQQGRPDPVIFPSRRFGRQQRQALPLPSARPIIRHLSLRGMRLAAARRLLLSPPRPPPARRSFAASASACSSAAPDDAGPRTSGRNLLARYAPGAPPIPSASDVPLEQLLDRTAAVGAPAGDVGRPDELVPSPSSSHEQQQQQQLDRPSPDRPRVEMQDVLTPAHPAKGDGRMVVAGVEVPVKPERPGDEGAFSPALALAVSRACSHAH